MTLSFAEPRTESRLTDQDWQASNTTSPLLLCATLTGAVATRREFRFPFDGGEFVVEIVGDPATWVEPTVRALVKLLQLGPNWDTYGGSPMDPMCIAAALNLIFDTLPDDTPVPSVVPTSQGGLQLEWHTCGIDLEVEFLSATRVCGLFEDAVAGTSWEKDLSVDLRPFVDAVSALSQRQ